jgi:hypothetical protein
MQEIRWGSERGVDRDHETLYQAALIAYEMVRGEVPDQRWRALLYLATGDRDLWAWLAPRLDLHQGNVRLNDVEPGGEPRHLLILARHLFQRNPAQVNLVTLLGSLGDRNRAVALGALGEFCG